ncbi:MAG: response regulator [Rubinisphaera brasiliensis]|uniref:Two component transcriptional regulator, LuxR family n=1 Tax=Rubinisphaera brasiliensis (strain ATCC 49424 / DSM 5305 / JCM 21570 / IAM 15109 / NBRC 103401 / IFAM 1448) TaxID=756272 RepID=F0SLD0_RUBBR|nr:MULTISPECIES: response regulator transcription factor [Rubinisphaera]ADY62036.1 two component transcriptional regulator, LuxR family [Rubinisphaera brasiliensis DSM 5305]MBR9800726.1 response regulator transcription factor [bacterium]
MVGVVTSEQRPATKTVRILLVDDHPVVRQGLRMMIEREGDMQVCGEANGMAEAMKSYFENKPEVVVVDISLHNGSGIELVKELIAHEENLKILVCSMHDESLFADRALHAGAKGYINKEEAMDKLIDAIRRVAAGRVYLSDQMTDRMLCRQVGAGDERPKSALETLSDRELEVFEQIGHGVTTRQIAEKLHLSPKTVETYRENIKHKLNLANATELTQHAVQWVLEEC